MEQDPSATVSCTSCSPLPEKGETTFNVRAKRHFPRRLSYPAAVHDDDHEDTALEMFLDSLLQESRTKGVYKDFQVKILKRGLTVTLTK